MSWQDYVDKQLMASRCVTKAAIAGHDGNVWAKSEGFEVSFSLCLTTWTFVNVILEVKLCEKLVFSVQCVNRMITG